MNSWFIVHLTAKLQSFQPFTYFRLFCLEKPNLQIPKINSELIFMIEYIVLD